MNKFRIHLFVGQDRIGIYHTQSIPALGSEIRLTEKQFYTVIQVVHCFDEHYADCDRVNIKLEPLKNP